MGESDEEARAELERLRAENAALRAETKKGSSLKVSVKGAVSLYGLRRFPITFYMEEWNRILGMADEIRAFIRKNEAQLKKKDTAT